jgi:hypothetical protein
MTSYQPISQFEQSHPTSNMTVDKSTNAAGLPRLPINLRDHKVPIGITWGVILLANGILPIVGYFALRYGTNLELNVVLSPWLALMGVVSIYSLGTRTYSLMKKDSNCRPLGVEQGWKLDFFGWNFVVGFIGLTIFISLGISLKSVVVSLELVLGAVGMAAGMRAPFRFSSLAKGEPQRPGTMIIVEDVVAVDGKQGRAWREAWLRRYEASPALRSHLRRMDLIWGVSGLAVVAAIWGCVFGINDHDVGYAVGWALPWVWAGLMTMLTIQMSKSMLRKEAAMQGSNVPA